MLDPVTKARILRKNQTKPEEFLWSALRRSRLDVFQFRRQHPVGRYIVDFICRKASVVVEIDGPSHDQTVKSDAIRTAFLEKEGYRVIRFSNNYVLTNLEGVVETIRLSLVQETTDK